MNQMNLKFRKKPVVIEAFQITKERCASNADWPEWMHRAWQLDREAPGSLYPTEEGTGDGTLSIGTLEGPHLVSWGDWIIQGVKGELYPCKPDIFEMTYAPETKLEAQLVAAQAVPSSVIVGAIFDFAGYLTTLPQSKAAIHCSEVHDAVPMVKAITEWCKRRNLCTADARVEAWREAIATHPTQQGLDAQ